MVVTPRGAENKPAGPMPPAPPTTPGVPPMVVTTPAGVTLRMVWLVVSTTIRLPSESKERSKGLVELRGDAGAIRGSGYGGEQQRHHRAACEEW